MSRATDIAKNTADRARQNHHDRAAARVLKADRATAHSGEYLGFNADLGVHQVRLPDGSLVQANSGTNGGVAIGSVVSVNRPKGSEIGFMRAMSK